MNTTQKTSFFYPQYYQYTENDYSYVFKFKDDSSLALKIYNASRKCVFKESLQTEILKQKYLDRITKNKDFSIVLEYLVKIGIVSREYFPIPTKIDQVQKLINKQDLISAEKIALQGLNEAQNESNKMQYYELLEEIYETLKSDKIETLWASQAQHYIKLSQLDKAEKIYKKAYNHFKSVNAAGNLAWIFGLQKKYKESVQMYYEAVTLALFHEELEKISECFTAIREIDPGMENLDGNQKMFLLMLTQLSKVSESLKNQQYTFLNFLTFPSPQNREPLLESILHNAVEGDRIDVVKGIIRHWKLVKINKIYGHEPLIIIAARKGNAEMVKELLTHPDINIGLQQKSGHHLTALATAEQSGFKDIVTILYNHSQSLEKNFLAFKNKPLGEVEYLHIYENQGCSVFTGIDSEGNKKLLHISYQLKRTGSLQQELDQLLARGLKYKAQIQIGQFNSNRLNDDKEKIKSQFGKKIANISVQLSTKINDLIKNVLPNPSNESVIYRAIALKETGYFME